jgi:hypothetical protein
MKKTAIILILIMVINLIPATVIADTALSDINGHWAKSDIEYLVGIDVVDGFPDGTFKPQATINADAFIKLVVTSLGFSDIVNGADYWASNYINKAKELGLLYEGEFTNYNVPITRADMSRIISRALWYRMETFPEYLSAYRSLITDYENLELKYKTPTLENICKGIITGYPDGAFKPLGKATRAEGVTVIVRLINEDRRKPPVFATPDYEWEAWVNSEEASEYCSNNMFTAVDGKIVFNSESYSGYSEQFIPAYEVSDINKIAYEVIKHLTTCAKNNGHYISTHYSAGSGISEGLPIGYYYSKQQTVYNLYDFSFSLKANKRERETGNYYINHRLASLWNAFEYTVDEIINEYNHVVPVYEEAYRGVLDILYPDNSDDVYDYFINEYINEKTDNKITDEDFYISDIHFNYINGEGVVIEYWSTY